MKRNIIFNAMRNIDPKYIEAAAPSPKRPAGVWLRIAAVAACVALLAAGMLAAMPFMFKDNNVADVTEPQGMQPMDTEIKESTGDVSGALETDKESTVMYQGDYEPAAWLSVQSAPWAIIDIIEIEDEIKSDFKTEYRKIKCSIIYSANTTIYGISEDEFAKTEYVFIKESEVDNLMKATSVFCLLYRSQIRNEPMFVIDTSKCWSYVPFVDGKLVFDGGDDQNLILFSANENIENNLKLLSINEKKYSTDELIMAFPKKSFATGMTIDEFIDNMEAMTKAAHIAAKMQAATPNVNY